MGFISAAQDVMFGEGKSAPFNVVVKDKGSALRVETSFSLSGGLVAPEDSIKEEFCGVLDSVQ